MANFNKFVCMDTPDLKVYTTDATARLDYILSLLLGNILGLRYQVITDRRKIGNTPLINYSSDKISGAFHIFPAQLLAESNVRALTPGVEYQGELPVLFPSNGRGDIPFDIFSASFYLVSRYEEHLPFTPDRHGRYPAGESVAARNGFLQRPVVDLWTKQMALELIKKFPFLTFRRNEYRSLITFDIDQAFAYRGKGFLRGAAGLVSDMVKGGGYERVQSLSGGVRDPFDVYDYIIETLDSRAADTIFFLPYGKLSEFDRNTPAGSRMYRDLAKRLSDRFSTGIHFSYSSGHDSELMAREVKRFLQACETAPDKSRQHYLLLSFPDTYRALIANNIHHDYTMGYASDTGFRAGISRPFRFYDLPGNRITRLTVHPFQIMDVTLKNYLKLSPAEAISVAGRLMEETKKAGGVFTSIWHNSNLTERDGWEGWREVFEFVVKN
jgi:hypothetical protein